MWHSRMASGGIYLLGHSGHVALWHGIRRDLSARSLGTRGTLRRLPEGGSPGWSSRDAWRTRNAPGVSLPAGVTRAKDQRWMIQIQSASSDRGEWRSDRDEWSG